MTDLLVSTPLSGARAFASDSEIAAWSQAGLLATLGAQLTDDADLISEMPPGGVRVPRLQGPFGRADADQVLRQAGWDSGNSGPTIAASASFTEVQARLWSQAATARAAAALIYHSMASRHDVVRVVSAAEVLRLGGTADPQAVSVLAGAFTSSSMTVQTIAASALETVQPGHPALRDLTGNTVRPAKAAAEASVLVHGTFARLRSNWWRPGGDFFDYLKAKVSPNLYDAPDHFRWSSRYTQGHREAGGQDLAAWTDAASVALDTVFAHSHGGNVALDAAARNGVRMRLLVLLSTPAFKEGKKRPSSDWPVISRNIGRIIAVRAHCDLVILLDRSRQDYPAPPVRTLVLPGVWFNHSATLSPEVWERANLPKEIRFEHSLARQF